MKIRAITLDEDELPVMITVEMTVDEAGLLAAHLGNTRPKDREAQLAGFGVVGSDIYEALVGSVFNRYYEDGVREYLVERRKNR